MPPRSNPPVVTDPQTGRPTDAVGDPIGELSLVTAETQPRLWNLMRGPRAHIREAARDYLRRPDFAPVYELPRHEHRERILRQLRELGGSDVVAIGFPEHVGGGGDVAAFVTGFEELAYGDVSLLVKVGVHFGLFGGAIQHLGTDRHHTLLPRVIDTSLPGCFAMTETGHGSDVQSLETTATYDPVTEEFVVHTPGHTSWKDYIGNAAEHARLAVVFAQLVTPAPEDGDEPLTHGVHALLVPLRDEDGNVLPGITIEDNGPKLGLNGVDNGRIAFDHVRVPRTDLLDRFGSVAPDGTYTSPIENPTRRFFTMLGTLVQGRVAVSGGALSAAKLALTIATRHAYTRSQFSPDEDSEEVLLIDYLSHQRRLLPRLATTFALHFAQQQLVEEFGRVFGSGKADDRDRRRLEMLAAGTKAMTTWHATDCIQGAREACGGFGYLSENRLGQLKADVDVFTTFEGDNTVLMQLVAKSLLTGFREEFEQMGAVGYVRLAAETIVDEVAEWTFARQLMQSLADAWPAGAGETSVLDRGLHVKLFGVRADETLRSVAQRLRAMSQRAGAFEAFNHCQDHVLLAARAFMDRTVLEAFVAAIDACEDEDVAQLLNKLCDLYACSVLERERAWFLEHGHMTNARAKALIATVNELCGDLRPYAQVLARSLGVPKDLVRAPIALRHHGESYLEARERLLEEGVIGQG